MIRICPVCGKTVSRDEDDWTYECESSSPFHSYYEETDSWENTDSFIRVDKGDYFIILINCKKLEVWIDISGKGDKQLYSAPCNFEYFSKLCKLDNNAFNYKLRLLHVFS
jgi:hypothetical protein